MRLALSWREAAMRTLTFAWMIFLTVHLQKFSNVLSICTARECSCSSYPHPFTQWMNHIINTQSGQSGHSLESIPCLICFHFLTNSKRYTWSHLANCSLVIQRLSVIILLLFVLIVKRQDGWSRGTGWGPYFWFFLRICWLFINQWMREIYACYPVVTY